MDKFQVGYATVNINPPLGIAIAGYYVPRYASGFYDDLTASALSLAFGEKKFIIFSIDCCSVPNAVLERMKDVIVEATNIPREHIIISATHTHTGSYFATSGSFPVNAEQITEYVNFVINRVADLAVLSLAELKPAKMG